MLCFVHKDSMPDEVEPAMDVQYSCSAGPLNVNCRAQQAYIGPWTLPALQVCKCSDHVVLYSQVCSDRGLANWAARAAKAAGMTCIVTKSAYTQNEDFANADAVVDCIGESGQERFSLHDMLDITKAAAVAT